MSNEKKSSHISPERMDRFTWHEGEIKFLTAEEFEQIKQSKDFIDYRAPEENLDAEKNSVDKAKSEAYKKLVERAQKQYPEYRNNLKPTEADKPIACGFNPKEAVALFAPVINGVNICNEINLYSYWQGFGYAKKTPKIKYLLVAQDWGALHNEEAVPFKETINQMNAGKATIYPVKSVTSKNLVELFKILGRDITKPCDDVFFTNFCLGYRLHYDSGDMTKELMMKDAALFRELCEILEPENILCLGKITSECVYETLLSGNKFSEIYRGYKNYNDFLDNHPQIVIPYGNGKISNFYPLAHCGAMGTMNRNRGYNLPEIKADSLFKQREDWQKIIDEKRIDIAIEKFYQTNSPEDKERVLDEIFSRVQANDSFIVALNEEPMQFDAVLPIFQNMKSVFLRDKHDGKYFLAAFTNLLEFAKFNESSGRQCYFMFVPVQKLLIECMKGGGLGDEIVLNPAGNQFKLTREHIESLSKR